MKKTYQVPEIEVLNFVESTDLLTMSQLYDEPTSEPLSRETEMFFDDED